MAKFAVAAALVLVAALLFSAEAQQCNTNIYQLAYCLGAAQQSTGNPGQQCCQSLLTFRGKPDCLCQTMLAARKQFTFSVPNALTIPGRCGYANEIPSHYKCGDYVVGH